jgi:hypothetical protein
MVLWPVLSFFFVELDNNENNEVIKLRLIKSIFFPKSGEKIIYTIARCFNREIYQYNFRGSVCNLEELKIDEQLLKTPYQP